jgi:hypothetical protein
MSTAPTTITTSAGLHLDAGIFDVADLKEAKALRDELG